MIRTTTYSLGTVYRLLDAAIPPANIYSLAVEADTRHRKRRKRLLKTCYCGMDFVLVRQPGGNICIMVPEEYHEEERIRLEKKRKQQYQQLQRKYGT